jgi:hypothetical protein
MSLQGNKETIIGLQEVGIDYYIIIWYQSLHYSILQICM